MSITKEQFNKESDYLKKVLDVFDDGYKEELESFSNIKERVSKLRRHLIENKDTMDAGEISQLRQAIERMILTGDVTNKKYQLLQKVQKAPYFARLDFEDHTFEELYKMYIGLTSIYKKGQAKYLVYDWRSPAASMYYEESVGKASYEAPVGTIEGEIILKRQYKIEDRILEFVFDNNINIDDELLKEALVKNTSAKMKNIVNSIQKEQNLVIRNQNDEVLIIDGPAGSGKTSVALHRIAFLLYRDREHLKAENIVILSPNQVFSEYISSVLPELGEDNVDYLTFSEYYVSLTNKYTVAQNFSNYTKNLYEQTDPVEIEVNRFKASNSFKKLVDEYFNNIEEKTASLLEEGKVIGWFQGKMETGLRALGNRSILGDPRKKDMKDIINNKVKFRESWRPFCPSILDEFQAEYIENSFYHPYMIIAFQVKPEKVVEIPSVVHVDNTARIQSVSKRVNPKYWKLINEFRKLTNVPVLLNTSFNIKGEPIVCTPDDALNTFQKTGMDYLVMGNYLISK